MIASFYFFTRYVKNLPLLTIAALTCKFKQALSTCASLSAGNTKLLGWRTGGLAWFLLEAQAIRGPCYIQILVAETFNLVSSEGLKWVECASFAGIPWLVHAFGTRQGGALAPIPRGKGSARDNNNGPTPAVQVGGRFLQVLGAGEFHLASIRQTHSTIIYCVSQRSAGRPLEYHLAGNPSTMAQHSSGAISGDALLSCHPGILLTIRVADCMPVFIVDPERRVIAAVHAGWRGALNRIISKTVGEMLRTFDSSPGSLLAAIGPSIRECCYEVGQEVVDAFCGAFPNGEAFFHKVPLTPAESRMALRYKTLFAFQAPPGHRAEEQPKVHLDLAAVARYQLEQAGVPRDHIRSADYCTACRTDLFYSYRREGSLAGRTLAVIGMRPLI